MEKYLNSCAGESIPFSSQHGFDSHQRFASRAIDIRLVSRGVIRVFKYPPSGWEGRRPDTTKRAQSQIEDRQNDMNSQALLEAGDCEGEKIRTAKTWL